MIVNTIKGDVFKSGHKKIVFLLPKHNENYFISNIIAKQYWNDLGTYQKTMNPGFIVFQPVLNMFGLFAIVYDPYDGIEKTINIVYKAIEEDNRLDEFAFVLNGCNIQHNFAKEEKAIDMFLKMLGDISKKATVYSIDQKYQIP